MRQGWMALALGFAVAGAGLAEGCSGGEGSSSSSSGGAQCQLTNITSATTQSCYDCMKEKCCAEMQACDQDADCVYCINNPIDSSARCVDPNTFSVYPNRTNLDSCQTNRCVPPCGAQGGSNCTPSDCAPSCQRYSTGCN